MRHCDTGVAWGVGLASAVGALTGIRAIASVTAGGPTPLLRTETLPRVDHGLAWTDGALWPADFQMIGSDALVRSLVVMASCVLIVALLNTVVLLAEGASGRRQREAVRLALGIAPRAHLRALLRPIAVIGGAAAGLGVVAGLAAGSAMRASWPGSLAPLASGAPGAIDTIVGLILAVCVVVGAQSSGLRYVRRPGAAASLLRSGGRAGDEPAAVFARSALSVAHVAVAASALLVALLSRATLPDPVESGPSDETRVLALSGTSDRPLGSLLGELREAEGVTSVSDSAPGALVGLGLRDLVVTECGNCWRSMLPAPLWSALADHHVVGPDWFDHAGVEIVAGRTFAEVDATEIGPVAVVDELLAATAFEDGEAIGRRLRVGRDYETWYTVIGIVADHSRPVVGEDGRRETVYLSSRQLHVQDPRVILRASDDGLDEAMRIVEAAGMEVTFAGGLSEYRMRHSDAFRWLGVVGSVLALLALLLAGHGTWMASLQSTRRRRAEFALRQAVGAKPGDLIALALKERIGIVAWGLLGFALLGTTLSALMLSESSVGVAPYLWAATCVSVLSIGSAVHAAVESTRTRPGTVLD